MQKEKKKILLFLCLTRIPDVGQSLEYQGLEGETEGETQGETHSTHGVSLHT